MQPRRQRAARPRHRDRRRVERSMSVFGSRCGCPRMRAASNVSPPAATSAMQPSTRLVTPELVAGIDAPTRSLPPTGPVIVSETTTSLRVGFALRRRSSLPSITNRTCAPSRSSRSTKDDSGTSAWIRRAPFSSAARLGSRQRLRRHDRLRAVRRAVQEDPDAERRGQPGEEEGLLTSHAAFRTCRGSARQRRRRSPRWPWPCCPPRCSRPARWGSCCARCRRASCTCRVQGS